MPRKKLTSSGVKAVLRTFWRHTKQHPWLFGAGAFGIVLQQVAYVISPLYLKNFFDILSSASPSAAAATLLVVPLFIYSILQTVAWIGGRMEMGFGLTIINKVSQRLVREGFAALIQHSYQFFTSSFSGALTRKVAKYGGWYERIYYSFGNSIVPATIYIVGIIIVLTYRNWVLGVLLIAWCTLFIGVQWAMVRWQQPLRVKRAEEDSNVTASLADAISNHHTVSLFSAHAHEKVIVAEATERYRKAEWKTWIADWWIFGIQGLFGLALNIGLLWVAAHYWQQGLLTVGDLVLIQAYLFGLFNHVWGLGREFRTVYMAVADAVEMITIMETPLEVTDKNKAKKLKVATGEIWFDDVSFTFTTDSPVLKEMNLKIAGGERIALVGPSGAGKSTITKLLLRLFDVTDGAIKIDGQDIRSVTQDSLREHIGFVPQEPVLFHRTLMENIRYGRLDATDEEVIEAAKQAHCHTFIMQLPQQYETLVGERGIKLSGGERQRVAIARALLKAAPILILDEATSSLDSESESLIQDALETLMQGKTTIVIAHRLSTIMKMDRIVVVEGGRIAAQGTHLELVNQGGLYQKLWNIQVGGFIASPEPPRTKRRAKKRITEKVEEALPENEEEALDHDLADDANSR